jgi:DMSO/TMAO reductase YedYZ molybdopterin-dependent catalytic subunit
VYPLKLVGPTISDGSSIGSLVRIDLRNIPTVPTWDLNGDHVCNISDVVVLGNYWGQRGANGWILEDLNHDGVINISDVVVLGANWGQRWP